MTEDNNTSAGVDLNSRRLAERVINIDDLVAEMVHVASLLDTIEEITFEPQPDTAWKAQCLARIGRDYLRGLIDAADQLPRPERKAAA